MLVCRSLKKKKMKMIRGAVKQHYKPVEGHALEGPIMKEEKRVTNKPVGKINILESELWRKEI